MSISRYPRYVKAADKLKGALVEYVNEVKMYAPELAPEVEKLMRSVLEQDVKIFNQLRNTK